MIILNRNANQFLSVIFVSTPEELQSAVGDTLWCGPLDDQFWANAAARVLARAEDLAMACGREDCHAIVGGRGVDPFLDQAGNVPHLAVGESWYSRDHRGDSGGVKRCSAQFAVVCLQTISRRIPGEAPTSPAHSRKDFMGGEGSIRATDSAGQVQDCRAHRGWPSHVIR